MGAIVLRTLSLQTISLVCLLVLGGGGGGGGIGVVLCATDEILQPLYRSNE